MRRMYLVDATVPVNSVAEGLHEDDSSIFPD